MHTLLYLSLAPVIALIIMFYLYDRYEPEPKKIVFKVFAFGIVSVLPAIIMELILMPVFKYREGNLNLLSLFIAMFFAVALVEELCKFAVIISGIYKSWEFDEPYDGIVYTVAASLGFAAFENILYVFNMGIAVGILRALITVPGHALYGALMGYFIGLSKFRRNRTSLLLWGLFLATLGHAIFDTLAFSRNPWLVLSIFPFIGFLWIVVFLLARHSQSLSIYRYNPQKEGAAPGSDKTCRACGYSVPSDKGICSKCGTPAEEPPGAADAALQENTAPTGEENHLEGNGEKGAESDGRA
ncbi:MAG: PrsW family glutamic-type intramembrane protease [Candidatus Eremiobacteraeota bacterium]|nr:PrsW family glutamic-type intramembrane protease [Candidatus Eremiobacteraeota bacterium]